MELAFWIAAFVVVYVYAGYPVLLGVWSHLAPRPVRRVAAFEPAVSIVIAARNGAHALDARLANLRALDYPRDKVQVVVVSDGSTDGTRAVLDEHVGVVDAVFQPELGKASALNAGVAAARHEILVFADVRQHFARNAVRALVAPLADPSVGGVSGELMLDCEASDAESSGIKEGIGGYWRYEKWLRRHESLIGSTVGATGAIYALRRSLWQPLPADTILDDVLAPMRAVLSSARVVFASDARAFDRAAPSDTELRRKIRTLAGNYQILRLEPRLLVPFVNPVWVQYVSHKVGRLIVPYALAVLFISSGLLAAGSAWYATAFGAQAGFYALAFYGGYLERRDRPSRTAAADASGRVAVSGSNE
jgi:cellulose synthase/poly-beta-1,6-N-acetylglucosamine synthase-like glycosyltransferase